MSLKTLVNSTNIFASKIHSSCPKCLSRIEKSYYFYTYGEDLEFIESLNRSSNEFHGLGYEGIARNELGFDRYLCVLNKDK